MRFGQEDISGAQKAESMHRDMGPATFHRRNRPYGAAVATLSATGFSRPPPGNRRIDQILVDPLFVTHALRRRFSPEHNERGQPFGAVLFMCCRRNASGSRPQNVGFRGRRARRRPAELRGGGDLRRSGLFRCASAFCRGGGNGRGLFRRRQSGLLRFLFQLHLQAGFRVGVELLQSGEVGVAVDQRMGIGRLQGADGGNKFRKAGGEGMRR